MITHPEKSLHLGVYIIYVLAYTHLLHVYTLGFKMKFGVNNSFQVIRKCHINKEELTVCVLFKGYPKHLYVCHVAVCHICYDT